MMQPLLSRGWAMLIARGVVTITFGIGALLWPTDEARLSTSFGLAAFAIGAIAIVTGLARPFAGRRERSLGGDIGWPLVIEGFVGIALGVMAVVAAVSALSLAMIVAAWAAVTGLLEIGTALQLRRVLAGERMIAVGGIASLLAAAVIALRAELGTASQPWLVGLYAVFFGVCLCVAGADLRYLAAGEPEKA